MEYIILKGWSSGTSNDAIKELERNVNSFCKEGWKPQGGITVTVDKFIDYTAFQAMVK